MGYRTVDAAEQTKKLAALKYALPKELKKTPYHGGELTTRMTQYIKLKYYYAGTKNAIHEINMRVSL